MLAVLTFTFFSLFKAVVPSHLLVRRYLVMHTNQMNVLGFRSLLQHECLCAYLFIFCPYDSLKSVGDAVVWKPLLVTFIHFQMCCVFCCVYQSYFKCLSVKTVPTLNRFAVQKDGGSLFQEIRDDRF